MPLDRHQRQAVSYLERQTVVRIKAGDLDLEFEDGDRQLAHEIAIAIQSFWGRRMRER
jgi:hypothetical protein